MKRKLMAGLVSGLCLAGMVGAANATVLYFDDLTTAVTDAVALGNYGGLSWTNMNVIHKDFHPGSGYDRGTVSGNYTAYNAWANVGTAQDTDWDFNGAYFTAAWDTTTTLHLKGYDNGSLVYDLSYTINNQAPTWIQADMLGIDSLSMVTSGNHFAMDNFTMNDRPVPEPATMFLFGTGLAGLVGSKIRRKRQA